jgi:glyoxylase-like metal-dependent hydrolase (beta-lactamase superfamily II)
VSAPAIGRRQFLVRAGRGVLGVAVLGLAGCSTGDKAGLTWSQVDLAYVSAYVLVRGGEAALVDTGFGSCMDRIGAVLDAAGPGWGGVRHVVITHAHGDHFDSLGEVADRAPGARLHAGAPDLDLIANSPLRFRSSWVRRRLHAVNDGDEVFGLQVVTTPGHTPGHVAVFDADSAVLVAGDALTNTIDGQLAGANPEFSVDMAAVADSVRKLAALKPQVILVGHGPPVLRDAAGKLRRLADSPR